jgi:hypothetical protein
MNTQPVRKTDDLFECFAKEFSDGKRFPWWSTSRKSAKVMAMAIINGNPKISYISVSQPLKIGGSVIDEYIRPHEDEAWFHKDNRKAIAEKAS